MLPRPSATRIAPLRSLTARYLRPTSPSTPLRRTWARFSSQQPPPPPPASTTTSSSGSSSSKPPSPNATFYQTFGRPMFKTILIAIFTYQVVYYFWAKLEIIESRADTQATISDLEARIEQLEKARASR